MILRKKKLLVKRIEKRKRRRRPSRREKEEASRLTAELLRNRAIVRSLTNIMNDEKLNDQDRLDSIRLVLWITGKDGGQKDHPEIL